MNHPSSFVPRRVLMTTDCIGGVWTDSLQLFRALAQRHVQVLLATMGGPLRPDQIAQAAQLRNVRLSERRFKLEWMGTPWRDVDRAGEWLLELEREFSPDIVHLNGYAHATLPFVAPKLVVGHSCVLSWWRAVKTADAPPEWDEYARSVRDGLHAADLVVTPSRAMSDALRRHYGAQLRPMVIPNGRDPLKCAARRKERLVLTAGRLWDEAKNTAAVAAIASDLPWPVILAGNCTSPDGTEVSFNNVTAVGHVSEGEMAALYARAAIYALPARYEPFGLTVLEAALSRCALVLGDIPSLRELWEGAAVFVSPSDPGALRQAITRLIEDAAYRQHSSAIAHARGIGMTAQRMGRAYLAAYAQLLTAPVSPSLMTGVTDGAPTAAALERSSA